MMRVLIDTNVVLDLLLNRQPFAQDSFALWKAGDQGQYERYVSAITPINVFYIARKLNGKAAAFQMVTDLMSSVRIAPVDVRSYMLRSRCHRMTSRTQPKSPQP